MLNEGHKLSEAIVEATVRRARPSPDWLAAILAMIPLTHSAFWGPGLHDHGRAVRRDFPDASVLARAVCPVVPQTHQGGGADTNER